MSSAGTSCGVTLVENGYGLNVGMDEDEDVSVATGAAYLHIALVLKHRRGMRAKGFIVVRSNR